MAAFCLIPLSGTAYFGLAQRLFLTIVMTWLLALALFSTRRFRAA
jgi:hypothetical protein